MIPDGFRADFEPLSDFLARQSGDGIPIIVGGATVIMAMTNCFPLIIWAGAALLGWLAGEMIATDPIVIDGARALGPTAHEKIALAFSIIGVAGTLLGGLLVRARQPVQV